MTVFVVANPKGGAGKSTIATNLAGWLAWHVGETEATPTGRAVLLGDVDRQESSRLWLSLRPADVPQIGQWDVEADDVSRPPRHARFAVLDTPAGLAGKRLDAVMKLADQVLVPLQPSVFDIHATQGFIDTLRARRKHSNVRIGVIANRVREHTWAADQLRLFLDRLEVPVLGQLRDTHNYLHLAAQGLSLWDVAATKFERDQAQWQTIVHGLDVDA